MAYSIFRPYLSKFDNISTFALLGGISAVSKSQVSSSYFLDV